MLYNYIKTHYKQAEPIFLADLLIKNITERSPLTLWILTIEEMNIKENIMLWFGLVERPGSISRWGDSPNFS